MKSHPFFSFIIAFAFFLLLTEMDIYSLEIDIGLSILVFAVALLFFRLVGLYIWFLDDEEP